ncbi:MAG: hypothetical protein VB855_17010, partial [Pirellulaceae bacterium]
MSKCDITIDFDRDDATYRGGETVSGTARVTVNKNLTSKGITLSRFWKTHGRGNTDTGEVHEEILASDAQLVAGETFKFPFSFEANLEPITYHGELINVDHFVKIQVDVPWARDPKLEAEYILRPGKIPVPPEPGDEEASKAMPKWVVVLLWAVFGPMLLMLLPILLPFFIYGHIKASMISKRLGKVKLETVPQTIGPGDNWSGTLRFTPKRDVPINGINARLVCKETAVSGSGTNRTSHSHEIHDEVHTLEPEGLLVAGKPFDKQFSVPFPETDAYSFGGGDNTISWSIEIRIDLPGVPDWKETEYATVVPVEFLDPSAAPQESPPEETKTASPIPVPVPMVAAANAATHVPEPTVSEPTVQETASSEPVAPQPTETGPAAPILSLLAQFADAENTGSERAQLIENVQGRSFAVTVEVERSQSTFTSSDGDQYEDGYTITGVVTGSEQTVELFTLNESSAEVRDLRRGDSWST